MPTGITHTVGRPEQNAANIDYEVMLVQRLLRKAAIFLGEPKYDPKDESGQIGKDSSKSTTINAILAFQSNYMAAPTGMLYPNGKTIRKLFSVTQKGNRNLGNGPYFPFSRNSAYSWLTGARRFASNRSNGARAHAGCDLYFPMGTDVHAVKDGKVTSGPTFFYMNTYYLTIDHGDFLIRYGEVKQNTLVKNGDQVLAGEKIGQVGHLVGITVPSDMLHLEMFDKSAHGKLSQPASNSKLREDGKPFLRRKDLIDPTTYLNAWSTNLPKA